MFLRIVLVCALCFLMAPFVSSSPMISGTNVDMTMTEYLLSNEDVGQIVVMVSVVPGNHLALDYTITNDLLVFEKLEKDQWIFLAGSVCFRVRGK